MGPAKQGVGGAGVGGVTDFHWEKTSSQQRRRIGSQSRTFVIKKLGNMISWFDLIFNFN